MSVQEMPAGWEGCLLGDIVNLEYGKSLPAKVRDHSGNVPVFGSSGQVGVHSNSLVKGPCIIVGRKGTAGAVEFSRQDCWPIDTTYFVKASPHVDTLFLYHLLRSMRLGELDRSTAIPGLNRYDAYAKAVALPPLPEQRRIVEKIETLFAQLDKGEEAVRQVQVLLKRYRQSVLKAAVTGELTADWRDANRNRLEDGSDLLARILKTRRESWQGRGRYKEPTAPDTSDLPELPEEWVWASLAQLTNIKGGVTVDRKREVSDPVTLPYLRVANVQNGYLDLSEIKEITVDRKKAEQCLLQPGDILLNEGGDRDKLGRGWVWKGQIARCIHQNHVFRARPVMDDMPSEFISYYANAFGQPFFMTQGKQSVNLASISLTAISGLPIPLPSYEEQRAILGLLDECLAQADAIADWCESALTRSTALRQSILKQAFSGRLVPQDPSDEPASDLLARIRLARTGTKLPARARKRKRA